jgi:ABC-type spermidine/putrescine transport system permease subunit II
VVVSLLALAAPPALVGDALAAAYVHVPFISDHGLIVSLVGAARFGFVAVAVLLLASRGRIVELERMAAADGANAWQSLTRVRWAVNLPAIVIAAGLVALLAFGEVAATQLVRPPGVGNLAMTLLNAIHFGRDDEVIAMTLCAVGFVGVGAGALLVLAARWARNTSDSARHEGL